MRAVVCPDKLSTAEWLSVVGSAHRIGLRTTATITVRPRRAPDPLGAASAGDSRPAGRDRGFYQFVPLPFVHMEAPLYLRGDARKGPTLREAVLMHAVARLVFHTLIPNIQTSWVKMGAAGVAACLNAGANDLGGTLMNESISRAAGTQHGQELPPEAMEELIRSCGRAPQQRLTTYHPVSAERRTASFCAPPLLPMQFNPPRNYPRQDTHL